MIETIIAVAVGGILTGIPTIWNSHIIRRSEEKRQLREIAFKSAIENWKLHRETAFDHIKNVPGGTAKIEPLDVYIFHMIKLSEIATKKDLTPDTIAPLMHELYELIEKATDEATAFTEKRNESRKRKS